MFRILARSCTQYYLWLWRFMTYSREILDAFPALTKMLTLPFSQVPFKDNSFKLSMIMTAIGLCPSKPFCGPWPYFGVTQQLGSVKLKVKVAFSWQIFLCSSCNFLLLHACRRSCMQHYLWLAYNACFNVCFYLLIDFRLKYLSVSLSLYPLVGTLFFAFWCKCCHVPPIFFPTSPVDCDYVYESWTFNCTFNSLTLKSFDIWNMELFILSTKTGYSLQNRWPQHRPTI